MLFEQVFKNTEKIFNSVGMLFVCSVMFSIIPSKPPGGPLVNNSSIYPSPLQVFVLEPPILPDPVAFKQAAHSPWRI